MAQKRITSIDIMRGQMIAFMALDHAGVFLFRGLHDTSEAWDIAVRVHPSFVSFLTRNLSHLSAPGFALLLGVSFAMFARSRKSRGWSDVRIARFYATRGLLLIAIEQLVVNPAWLLQFLPRTPDWTLASSAASDVSGVFLAFGILSTLGIAMVLWSFCRSLASWAVAILSAAAILTTSIFIPAIDQAGTTFHPLYTLFVLNGISPPLSASFPILPWFGVVGLGILLGRWMLKETSNHPRGFLLAGLVSLSLFVVIRSIGGFGNIHPPSGGFYAFFALTKYPPSLVFLLLYLGLNLIVLAGLSYAFDQRRTGGGILKSFGSSSLFFYVVHLYVYGILGIVVWVVTPFPRGLIWVYPFWFLGLAPLYFACRGYRSFKESRSPNSIWRML